MSRQSFLQGALVLAAAGLVSKLLGILYRIPFARLVGAEGMGLYQMAYPIYTMVLAVATAGFPVAISVLVSEKRVQGDLWGMRKVFRLSLFMLAVLGLIMSCVLFAAADFLSQRVLHDHRAVYALRFIAPAIFFAGIMSAFRGFFQGQGWMLPTALSQVSEQIIRVLTVLLAAWWLLPLGPEYAAAGATFGAVTGGAIGLLVLGVIYAGFSFPRSPLFIPVKQPEDKITVILKRLFTLSFPIALGALVMPMIQTLDALLVPLRLQVAGCTMQEATELFGQLSGMAGTLVNLPGVITIALAMSLVPAVSAAAARQQYEVINGRLNAAIRLMLLFSLPAAVGFYVLGLPISHLLYGLSEAGWPLKALAPAVLFLGLYQVTSATLQGLGRTGRPVFHLILAGGLKVCLNYFLVAEPALGIQGAGIATGAAFALAAALNLVSLQRLIGYQLPWRLILLKPVIAVTIMALTVYYLQGQIPSVPVRSEFLTLITILAGGLVYGIAILVLGELRSHELELVPGMGLKLVKWLRYFNLVRD